MLYELQYMRAERKTFKKEFEDSSANFVGSSFQARGYQVCLESSQLGFQIWNIAFGWGNSEVTTCLTYYSLLEL